MSGNLPVTLLLSVGYPAGRRPRPGRRSREHVVFGERHGRTLV